MFCTKCGSEVQEGTRFCTKCGAEITQMGMMQAETAGTEKQQPSNAQAGNKNPKGALIAACSVLAVAIIALIIVLIVPFGDKKEEKPEREKKQQEAVEKDRDAEDEQDEETEETDSEDVLREDTEEVAVPEEFQGVKTDVNIEVRQVDNSNFPEVTLYASITDSLGNAIENLNLSDFKVSEITEDGNLKEAEVEDIYQVIGSEKCSVNLVLDASGSMNTDDKIYQAKSAAKSFVDYMDLESGDQVEVICFNDYVYLQHEFSSDKESLKYGIEDFPADGQTALYDALYSALNQTFYEDGAKCVIGFTDGMENASSYSFEDVVDLAQNTGIPVYIIGIGEEYDAAALQELAALCSGQYYSANTSDLESILEDIYISIYEEQKNYYVLRYKSKNMTYLDEFRDVIVETTPVSPYNGSYTKSFVPKADVSGAFSESYMNKDYMLDFSSQRVVTESDLRGMSLAELRIARNEIFARHGRQFKDSMLNEWFYSKMWYLNIPMKYSPDSFDRISPSPLSRMEIDNANFIKAYEDRLMQENDIYPNASSVLLSEYDLALSKPVLKLALEQMQQYPSSDILRENQMLVQEAINKEDVRY